LKSHYQHLFFDLDHTLWDADGNSAEALSELFSKHGLASKGISSFEEFNIVYNRINSAFWVDYAKGKVSKQTLRYKRFLLTLRHFALKNYDLSYALSEEYIGLAPTKSGVQPHTHEVIEYLAVNYKLHIITNGFEDAQFIKLRASGLQHFFQHLITPEKAGSKKPSSSIFHYALDLAKAQLRTSLMIGDDLQVDIIGARSAGMDQVYYNIHDKSHTENVTFEIKSLIGLKRIL
jgi:putative hydrolase of the HAD superfamily